jgi:thioester reductase-like protein
MVVPNSELDNLAKLDDSIQPHPDSDAVDFTVKPHNVFITGVTGFVAAFAMKELLEQTPAKLYGLVRADSAEHGLERIRQNMASYHLWKPEYEQRVVAVNGDLKNPHFGLSEKEFQWFGDTMDAVYHVGSKLSYVAPYAHLAPQNVGGTEETIRLAVTGKAKPYHFVSSLGILLGYHIPVGGQEDDEMDATKCPEVGYFQTKYVAERVVRIARERGIPLSIYRIGLIVGESEHGLANLDDFVARIMIGCVQSGFGPDVSNDMDMTPVDYIGKTMIYLAHQQASKGQVFHLLNPQPITWGGIMDTIIQAGYPITKLPFHDWVKAVEDHAVEGNPLLPLMPFFHIPFAARMLGVSKTAYHALGTKKTQAALNGSGIVCAPVDKRMVATFLNHFRETGRLPAVQQ